MANGLPSTPAGIQNQITAAFKQQFHDSFEIALQQTESALSGLVTSRGQIQGASFTINDLGSVEMEQRKFADRFSTTQFKLPEAGTRLAIMEDYDLFIPIEPFDLPKLSAAPDSPYMRLMVAAANRAKDRLIYRQLFAEIQRRKETEIQPTGAGAAVAASTGAYTATPFATGQVINAVGKGYAEDSTTHKMTSIGTVDKASLIKLRALFMKNFADNEEIYVTYNDAMLQQILSDTELTNADYMAIQMLQSGEVGGKWLGMNFVKYQELGHVDALGADTTAAAGKGFKAAAFTKSALHFGTGINYSTDVQTRADLRNIKQLSAQMSFGAGRANELKVAQLNFLA
ncbi:phage capsid protein [Enterobacter bugandensis]|uniref:phage capsid protein n=1 Tax=Enterobacter bugandensis TaxID=881260 RepID=UPI002004A005|nr:phage capsid protein [Enterobacter bugandensis]MCK7435903.1 phage capsid protein [Enterobacter bugandensis]